MTPGLFVAAMTTTFDVGFRPSMRVKSWLTMRRSTSPPALSRAGAMESISSMKMIDGLFFSASSNAWWSGGVRGHYHERPAREQRRGGDR